jgi:hypothetical protein
VVGWDGALVTAVHLAHTDAQFVRQGLDEGSFHNPFQAVELMEIESQPIVFHDSPVFLLVLSDDTEWGIVDQFRPMYRLPVSQRAHAFALNDFPWHSQPDLTVETTVTAPVELPVVIQDHDVVAEKPCALGARV